MESLASEKGIRISFLFYVLDQIL